MHKIDGVWIMIEIKRHDFMERMIESGLWGIKKH